MVDSVFGNLDKEATKAIYKMVGSDVFVAYKNNLIEVID